MKQQNIRTSLRFFALILSGLFLFAASIPEVQAAKCSGEGYGTSVGDTICRFIGNTSDIPGLISAIAYIMGILFGLSAVVKFKDHVENPSQVQIWEPLKRLIAGGALFSLPLVTQVLLHAFMGDENNTFGYSGFVSADLGAFGDLLGIGGGLDAALVGLIADIWKPMHFLFSAFAYLAGLVFVLIGISRLVKSAQDGARGPGGIGTIATFLTAGVLFSLDSVMGSFSNSIFGDSTVSTLVNVFAYPAGMSIVEIIKVSSVISAVLGFVALVGWISFIRGWFIVRDVAEGKQQASMMAGSTHILGGAMAVNLGPLLNTIQRTLDIGGPLHWFY